MEYSVIQKYNISIHKEMFSIITAMDKMEKI